MTAEGVLVAGRLLHPPNMVVRAPAKAGGEPWCQLHPDDYTTRRSTWVSQIIVHTTGGLWPQYVRAGAGAPGHARQILDMWSGADRGGGERVHSAAQLVVDFDGSVACAADLVYDEAYHAEGSNPRAVGVEMSTMPDGSIYEATLSTAARLVDFLCWPVLPIPRQRHVGPYRDAPLPRMETGSGASRRQLGGATCVGVFGHRDNTSERGRGDPGDAIGGELDALGFEALDYSVGQDLVVGRARQRFLVARGAQVLVDGVVGPASLAAARSQGYAAWRDVPQAAP